MKFPLSIPPKLDYQSDQTAEIVDSNNQTVARQGCGCCGEDLDLRDAKIIVRLLNEYAELKGLTEVNE